MNNLSFSSFTLPSVGHRRFNCVLSTKWTAHTSTQSIYLQEQLIVIRFGGGELLQDPCGTQRSDNIGFKAFVDRLFLENDDILWLRGMGRMGWKDR